MCGEIFHGKLHSAAFQLAAQIVMKVLRLSTLSSFYGMDGSEEGTPG